MLPPNTKTTKVQHAFRLLLGAAMLFAGISHLTTLREAFTAQVPDWVPLSEDLVVVLSGWVEIGLGLSMLLLGRCQVWVGLALATFYVLVFPGNVSQYINGVDAFGLDTDAKRLVRLFFQPVLIFWALWSTGAISFLRAKRSLKPRQ